MKYAFTVTVDVIDPNVYTLDDEGWAVGYPIDQLNKAEVAGYIAEAVRIFGGQFAPGDPLFPSNIRSVRVRDRFGRIDLIAGALRKVEETEDADPA